MRKILLAMSAATMVVTTSMALPYASAEARKHYRDRGRDYRYSEWRGRDGRYHCRRPDGTVGTILGGVGGALIGRTIDTRGDRTTGTVLGAAGGALLGNQIAKGGRRCR
jgi:uncharacterized protein YcfJ